MSRRLKALKIILLVADLVLAILVFQGAYILRFGELIQHGPILPGTGWFVPIILTIFYVLDVYNPWSRVSGIRFHFRVIPATIVAWAAISLFAFIFYGFAMQVYFGRGILFISFGLYLPAVFIIRYIAARLVDPQLRPVHWLVIGEKDYHDMLKSEIDLRGGLWHTKFLALSSRTGDLTSKKQLELEQQIGQSWTGIIIAARELPSDLLMRILKNKQGKVPVYNLLQFYSTYYSKIPLYYLNESIIGPIQQMWNTEKPVTLVLKDVLDKMLALALLLLAAPFMLIIALAIKLESRGPIFYKQERSGRAGFPFTLFKFRSMTQDAEKDGPKWATEDDNRITRVGRIMRVTRIDELPQLWNIIRGEMSFVGPRPERPYFVDLIAKEVPYYKLRHSVKPGLTGWAQILYPYGSSIEDARQKLEYDLYYLRNFSLLLDVIIMIKTVRVVLFYKGR